MKLRFNKNSIRFRLLKTDVYNLVKDAKVEEQIRIGSNTLKYALILSDTVESITPEIMDLDIRVYLPSSLVDNWDNDQRIGFDHYHSNDDGSKLYILIEKDFKCLDEVNEDQSDNYENPNKKD